MQPEPHDLAPAMGPGDLKADRFLPGTIYAPAVYGFFSTTDDGLTWGRSSAGLADVVDPGTGDRTYGLLSLAQPATAFGKRLYVGTARGLYTRASAAGAWYKITGLAYDTMAVDALLTLDGAPDDLYVTTAWGVFVYDLALTPQG